MAGAPVSGKGSDAASIPVVSEVKPVSAHLSSKPAILLQGIESRLKHALGKAGFQVSAFEPESLLPLLELPAGRTRRPVRPVAVFWTAPEQNCAAALVHGADPSSFLAQWRTEVEQLLSLFRRHRRALALIEASSLTDPGAVEQHQAIRKRLLMPDLKLPLALARPRQAKAKPRATDAPDPEAFLEHLSRLILRHDPVLPGLLAELDAASISTPPTRGPGMAPAQDVLASVARWRAGMRCAEELETQAEVQQSRLKALDAMLDAQGREIGALKAEQQLLHRQVELQLEAMNAQAEERQSQPPEAQPEFQQLAQRLEEQGRDLAAAHKERTMLRQQLATAEEALSASTAEAAALPWTGADLLDRVSLGPGATRADGVIRLSAGSVRSHALFGPYLRLPPGTYEACVALVMKPRRLERPVAALELAWNVDDILGSHRVVGRRLQEQSFVLRQIFSISAQQSAVEGQGLEIRLWTDLIAAGKVSVVWIRKM